MKDNIKYAILIIAVAIAILFSSCENQADELGKGPVLEYIPLFKNPIPEEMIGNYTAHYG